VSSQEIEIVLLSLRAQFGEESFSRYELAEFVAELDTDPTEVIDLLESEGWIEWDEDHDALFLSHDALKLKEGSNATEDVLSLGDLEERIVSALEEGRNIPWGKVGLAMWIFFLFIVVYTVIQTVW
jgi:hypothetical protein